MKLSTSLWPRYTHRYLLAVQGRFAMTFHEDERLVNIGVGLLPYLPTPGNTHQDDLAVAAGDYQAPLRVASALVC